MLWCELGDINKRSGVGRWREKMDMRANIGICGHFDWHMTGFIVLYHYFLVVNQPDSTDSAFAEQRIQWGEP